MPTNSWLKQWFRAKAAQRGGLIRRKKATVLKLSSLPELEREVKARGWHLWETADQYVIFCHSGVFKTIC
jgi:hypothetical protein